MDQDREYRLTRTQLKVEGGLSRKHATAKYGISRSTLSRKIKGQQERHATQETNQRLTNTKKRYLALWIANKEEARRAPSKPKVSEFASCILKERGDNTGVGKRWINGFLYRNNDIKLKKSRTLKSSRAKESVPEKIDEFLELLGQQIEKKQVKPQNITNLDENGVQKGESEGGQVLGTVLRKGAEVKKSEATTWVSILKAIVASGKRLTPLVVFTNRSLQAQWFPDTVIP